MKSTISLLLCLLPLLTSAQNNYSDSLINRINQKDVKTKEVFKLYNLLVEQLRNEAQYDGALSFCDQWIAFAKSKKENFELTKAYVAKGIIYNNLDNYDEDKTNLNAAQLTASHTENEMAGVYANYLNVYILLGFKDYENALKVLQKALDIAEKSTDEFIKAKIYYQFYSIYSHWNDKDNSFYYAKMAVDSAEKSGDPNLISNTYAALAVCYTYKYTTDQKKEDLNKVFEVSKQNIALEKKYKGRIANRLMAIAQLNLGSYYLRFDPENQKLIVELANSAIHTARQSDGNALIAANGYGILSEIARKNKKTAQAENYLNLAYRTLKQEKKPNYYSLAFICGNLSEFYAEQNQFEAAYRFQKESSDYANKLFDESQATISKKLQAQYQFEKKEQEVSQLKEKAKSDRKQKILYAGLGLIGLLSAFFMFRSYHYKLRFSIEKEKKLTSEKNKAELQAKYEKEEQAKLKAEKELLKLQQEKLQNEVMANQLHIQYKNKVLKQLKEKLENEDSVNIGKVLKEQTLIDNDFEKAKFRIQEIHPDFFKNLIENADKKLTALDLKYCAYIYLGMGTKQIANLLNVEPKSVRMTKYRLKKKLKLDKKTDLDEYLKAVV